MNELTKQLQEIMVPKAALIAYEYQEGHYASCLLYTSDAADER